MSERNDDTGLPLVKGGQGRSDEATRDYATSTCVLILAACVVGLWAALQWVLG